MGPRNPARHHGMLRVGVRPGGVGGFGLPSPAARSPSVASRQAAGRRSTRSTRAPHFIHVLSPRGISARRYEPPLAALRGVTRLPAVLSGAWLCPAAPSGGVAGHRGPCGPGGAAWRAGWPRPNRTEAGGPKGCCCRCRCHGHGAASAMVALRIPGGRSPALIASELN